MAMEEVVRVGETLRRPWKPWSTSIAALLDHLADSGFSAAPRDLGRDEQGRHVLSWLEGDVYTAPWPSEVRSETALRQIGQILRRVHGITARFPQRASEWITGPKQARADGHVILHGDLALANLVWNDGRLAGLIDWEFAEPGPAYHDVLHALVNFVPLFDDTICGQLGFEEPPDRRGRAAALLAAYGVPEAYDYPADPDPTGAIRDVLALLDRDHARIVTLGRDQAREPWGAFFERGDADTNRRIHAWIQNWIESP